MPWVTLRHFVWSEKTLPSGVVEVDSFTRVRADITLPVDIAELVYVNALAPAGAGHVKYATRVHELALITTYLTTLTDDALALNTSDFRSSSLHIKRFVTESLGLGMLTATVEALYRWDPRKRLHNFDALPVALARAYAKTGPRPDLLFEFDHAGLAGEARGRSVAAPARPRPDQRKRLNSLIAWSRRHDDHDIVMTWAYLTAQGLTVDMYTPSGEASWLPSDFGDLLPPETVPPEVADLLEFRDRMRSVGPTRDTRAALPPRSPDPTPPGRLVLSAKQQIDQVAEELFETAPDSDLRLAGHQLKGRWTPADALGLAPGVLLLGLLPESLPAENSGSLTAQLRRRGAEPNRTRDRFTATVRDRLVIAYAPGQSGQPWHLLRDVRQ